MKKIVSLFILLSMFSFIALSQSMVLKNATVKNEKGQTWIDLKKIFDDKMAKDGVVMKSRPATINDREGKYITDKYWTGDRKVLRVTPEIKKIVYECQRLYTLECMTASVSSASSGWYLFSWYCCCVGNYGGYTPEEGCGFVHFIDCTFFFLAPGTIWPCEDYCPWCGGEVTLFVEFGCDHYGY